jgi:hypothetical protein
MDSDAIGGLIGLVFTAIIAILCIKPLFESKEKKVRREAGRQRQRGIVQRGRQASEDRQTDVRVAKQRPAANVMCSTCQSKAVERVTLGTRAVSGIAGGILFSKKARAQFHCFTCGYYW